MNNSETVYKNAFGTALLMTDAEITTFANGIVAYLNLPEQFVKQISPTGARRAVVYLMDELAQQGKYATVGLDGSPIFHRLENAVFTAPDDLSRDRKRSKNFFHGISKAISIIEKYVSDSATISETEVNFASRLISKIKLAELPA